MAKTYLNLTINEKINFKSWWPGMPLAYFVKNGYVKEDINTFHKGYRTAKEQICEPNPNSLYKGMEAYGEQYVKGWGQLVKYGKFLR